MTDQLTVEALAKKTGLTSASLIAMAKQAGIAFASPQSVVSEDQLARLQDHIKKRRRDSTSTLSLGGGAPSQRPKLSVGGATKPSSEINIVHKRRVADIRGKPLNLDEKLEKQKKTEPVETPASPKAEAEAETVVEKKTEETTAKKTIKQPEKQTSQESNPVEKVARKPIPRLGKGAVPQIQLATPGKKASAETGKSKIASRKAPEKSVEEKPKPKEATATVDRNASRNTKPAEKKSRRSRNTGVSRRADESENIQLNEFQRKRLEGKAQEARNEPLRTTLLNQGFTRPVAKQQNNIAIGENVQVGELAHKMGIKAGELIKELMKNQVMATVNQSIDYDTAEIVADHFGFTIEREKSVDLHQLAIGEKSEHPETDRPPVVTVMGHVDHGKTSLLDYIRRTKVVDAESGGITQHIGAYHVDNDKGGITFLDTPGHAAFTAMRARGAQCTDIVILVVACDDKVMPQTIEAIQHARSAGVPIVVALNKIDKPEADPEKIINELAAQELVPESWGGDTQFVEVSAQTGKGIDNLLEALQLQADILELKASEQGNASGVIVESWLDKNRGPVATVLVQQGTLQTGSYVIAGITSGRVRAMTDERGEKLAKAGPSIPVEILGLDSVPEAGDELNQVANERAARDLVSTRREENKLKIQPQRQAVTDPFAENADSKKILSIVLKADTQGSIGAIEHALRELENDQLQLSIVLSGVGGITVSDTTIAHATGAKILGFNVRADKQAQTYCEKESVDLKYYSIIYELIEEVDNQLHGMLDPIIEEKILGIAEVRDVFTVSKFGKIAGCMVTEGQVHRNKPIRVLRDNVVIFEGELESLRRFKDDVKEVRNGTECGIGVKNYKDVHAGDKIEVFERVEKKQKPSRISDSQGSTN